MQSTFLTHKQQNSIHNAALEVLKTIGCKVQDKRWLKVLEDVGAKVDYQDFTVLLPDEDIIMSALNTCGKKVRYLARDPKKDVILGCGFPKAHTPEGAMHTIDLESTHRRFAELSDLKDLTRICDNLNNVDTVVSPIVPNDIPPVLQNLYSMKTLMENTTKPISPSGVSLDKNLPYLIQMQQLIAGDRNITDYNLGLGIFTTSPLIFPSSQLDILWKCAERRLPCSVGSAPQAGSTAPASLAGMLTQFTAEMLMGIVLYQLKNSGGNQHIFVRTYLINPRYGSLNCSNPEVGLIQAATTQLFKEKYKLPVNSGWAVSDSHTVNSQVILEKFSIWSQAFLSNTDMVSGISGLSSGMTSSSVQAIIDNEILNYLKNSYQDMIADDFHLAVNMIKDVGIGGTFLMHPDTSKILRKEQSSSSLTIHDTFDTWEKNGSVEFKENATKRAKEILENHNVEPLEKKVQEKIDEIIKEAKTSLL